MVTGTNDAFYVLKCSGLREILKFIFELGLGVFSVYRGHPFVAAVCSWRPATNWRSMIAMFYVLICCFAQTRTVSNLASSECWHLQRFAGSGGKVGGRVTAPRSRSLSSTQSDASLTDWGVCLNGDLVLGIGAFQGPSACLLSGGLLSL